MDRGVDTGVEDEYGVAEDEDELEVAGSAL